MMRAALLYGPGDVRIDEVADPELTQPTEALVQVLLSCVCGSDLWGYRASASDAGPTRSGHEFLGVVAEVGPDVTTLRPGDVVVAPFLWNDGTCWFCQAGLPSSCEQGGIWGQPGYDGGQGEAVRVPFADATLVRLPVRADDERLPALLTLSDVLGTGHHAAVSAGVSPGDTVAVVGDGAVGLCAVLAAHRLGAERIVSMSRHPTRSDLARRFGADDVVAARGPEGVAAATELTGGRGFDRVLECVGTDLSWDTALGLVRAGGSIGYVGVPAGVSAGLGLRRLYGRNIRLGGGVAPVRAYLEQLLHDVLDGSLDPSPVLDSTVGLDGTPDGYAAMDRREAIKVMIDLR